MITKQEYISAAERGAASIGHLPVSAAVLRYLSDQLKKGDPPWWEKTLKAWERRRSGAWGESWGLFLACLHYEALSDAKNPLVPYFPSCGGTAEADPAPALSKFLSAPPASFFEHLRTGELRVYYPMMSGWWTGPANLFFGERELQYYLVEVNTGAGLSLIGDLIAASQYGDFDSGLVAARVGLDPQPLLMEDINQRRWLTACVNPDNGPGIVALDRAIEALRKAQHDDPNFVQLVNCSVEKGPKFIAKNMPHNDQEVGLLVFNLMTTAEMTPTQYQSYLADMLQLLRPWGDRALWVEGEYVPGEVNSMVMQQRAHRLEEGLLKTVEFGRYDFISNKLTFNEKEARRVLIVES